MLSACEPPLDASAPISFAAVRCRPQAQPWFLTLNPAGTVPVLVRTPEGEGASQEVVAGSRAILHYVASSLPGDAVLTPPEGSAAHALMTSFLDMHDAIDAEDLAFAFGGLVTHAQVTRARVRTVAKRLAALRDDESAEAGVRDAAGARVEVLEARLARWEDSEALRAGLDAAVAALLDALQASLSHVGSGPFACGASYTLADVALTVFLAHAQRHAHVRAAVEARKQVRLYWSELVSRRTSFVTADVWTSARCGKAPEFVAVALAAPLRAFGGMWHRHVATPIASSQTYKKAATAMVDFQNDWAVPLEEEVKPAIAAGVTATAKAINAAIVTPAAEVGAIVAGGLNEHVGKPVAAAASATGEFVASCARCVCACARWHESCHPSASHSRQALPAPARAQRGVGVAALARNVGGDGPRVCAHRRRGPGHRGVCGCAACKDAHVGCAGARAVCAALR
jgi:glutathione S-transferase